jgi:hypothetical protein
VIDGIASAVSTGKPDRMCCQCLYGQVTEFGYNVRMSDQNTLTLRQVDQARTDFAVIEEHLEFIAGQLAERPTRGDLAKAALGTIFCTAIFTTLFVWVMWH